MIIDSAPPLRLLKFHQLAYLKELSQHGELFEDDYDLKIFCIHCTIRILIIYNYLSQYQHIQVFQAQKLLLYFDFLDFSKLSKQSNEYIITPDVRFYTFLADNNLKDT